MLHQDPLRHQTGPPHTTRTADRWEGGGAIKAHPDAVTHVFWSAAILARRKDRPPQREKWNVGGEIRGKGVRAPPTPPVSARSGMSGEAGEELDPAARVRESASNVRCLSVSGRVRPVPLYYAWSVRFVKSCVCV